MQFLEADAKTDEVGSLALPDSVMSGAIVEIPQRLGNVKRMPGLEADRAAGDPPGRAKVVETVVAVDEADPGVAGLPLLALVREGLVQRKVLVRCTPRGLAERVVEPGQVRWALLVKPCNERSLWVEGKSPYPAA